MAITFPLSWAAFAGKLRIVAGGFSLARYEETSGTARGQILSRQIAPPAWRAEISLEPMPLEIAGEIEALVERMGSSGTFFLHNPRRPFPALDPTGVLLGSSAPTIHTLGSDNRSMRLLGLPSGYVLSPGDMLAFDYGSNPTRRGIHRIVEAATASAAGLTPFFEVEPPLKTGTVTGIAVALRRPAAKMQLRSFDPGSWQRPKIHGMSFSAVEAF